MSKKPTNKLIAEVSGLTEVQVGMHLAELKQQANGDWLAYFGIEIEQYPEACNKLEPSKIVRIPVDLANNWYDRGNG
ncbi:hypothetical protein A1395_22265 [Pseudomonas protegens]|uniref:Uncharacterized protein n=1 Tax=Pseudomonas saponiphila TaxID=556534 RepID=A0A1H4M7D5_9PSED|nr:MULTISPECIES: hypothetical protein [Pseudomonas]PNG32233.1 hypothetical protein A1395_22265 [Pseudomonas protegens]SEB78658.1 hypothetical protein SAMN05216178_2254 [Pseudomonas saponiphila]